MILGYVIYNGASAIDWNFLTGLPLPPASPVAVLPMRWLAACWLWHAPY